MKVCLDTNAYSEWVRHRVWNAEITSAAVVCIPAIVLGELREGFLGGSRKKNNEAILSNLMDLPVIEVLEVGNKTSQIYADLKAHLRSNGTPIPTNDIWIAASAIQHGATLLTRDQHFKNLPQVQVRYPH